MVFFRNYNIILNLDVLTRFIKKKKCDFLSYLKEQILQIDNCLYFEKLK